MPLILVSFLAGMLTVLTPCSFTLLPVIIGTGLEDSKNKYRPYITIISLALSVLVFTILLKVSTLLIQVPFEVWNVFSGVLILLVGLSFLFPTTTSIILSRNFVTRKSEGVLGTNINKEGLLSAILGGVALGPIFTGCSPTYLLIVSAILPTDFFTGLIYLIFYILGLALILLLILFGGRKILNKFSWAANPKGKFKAVLGLILILLGALIITGLYRQIEINLLSAEFSRNIIQFENNFLTK